MLETRTALPDDLPGIEALLAECELSTDGVREHLDRFRVALLGGEIVGCAGVERYDDAGLLRSVATRTSCRGRGVATGLCRQVMETSGGEGIRTLYLLTETAERYFQRLGFQTIPRESADERLTVSSQFQGGTCRSAVVMLRSLG